MTRDIEIEEAREFTIDGIAEIIGQKVGDLGEEIARWVLSRLPQHRPFTWCFVDVDGAKQQRLGDGSHINASQ